jgi:diguanylate cyclase (GGDEF)-like protein
MSPPGNPHPDERSGAGFAVLPPRRAAARGLRGRLREDFDLAILLSVGLIAAAVVAGFAVFRFASDNPAGGLLNCVIVAALLAPLLYAARGGRTRHAGAAFVLVTTAACVASVLVFGRTGLFWGFLVLWIHFVVAPRPLALTVNLVLIVSVAGRPELFDAGTERVAYLVTALMITGFAWLVSSRLDRQRRQLRMLANEDPLTGAANRRQLGADLELLTAPPRGQPPAVLAVLDLDHFKRVNDAFGHEAGDRVLVALVEQLSAELREHDGLYRLGGEEFVLLLPQARLDEAGPRLQRLREALNQRLALLPGAVTVSIGAAELKPGEDGSHWLARADAALYAAKQNGRNRVMLAAMSGADAADAPT